MRCRCYRIDDDKVMLSADSIYIVKGSKLYSSIEMKERNDAPILKFTWYTNDSMPAYNVIEKDANAVFSVIHPAMLIPVMMLESEEGRFMINALPEKKENDNVCSVNAREWIKIIRKTLDSGFMDVECRGTADIAITEYEKMWSSYLFNH